MNNPWINYHHLFYFKTIAEEESVSKAAQKLRLGQPTLSAQLKQFEEALGVQLFERRHKRLVLTEHGELALSYAQNIFKIGNEMYEALHDRVTPSRLHLQIGALDCIPKQTVLEFTKAAYKVAPCTVSLTEGNFEELSREILAHHLDLVITNFVPTSKQTKGLHYRSVTKRPIFLYGAPQFKSLKKGFPKSISGKPLVLPTFDSKLRYDMEHWSQVHGLRFDIVAETQDIGLITLIAEEGLALTPSARATMETSVKSGKLVEIGLVEGVREEIFVMAADRKVKNPIAERLMQNFNF